MVPVLKVDGSEPLSDGDRYSTRRSVSIQLLRLVDREFTVDGLHAAGVLLKLTSLSRRPLRTAGEKGAPTELGAPSSLYDIYLAYAGARIALTKFGFAVHEPFDSAALS
jgi:hypothetical protein